MAADYTSSYAGSDIDDGVRKGKEAVRQVRINGVEIEKDNNGIVNLPAYPDAPEWGKIGGSIADQSDLQTALNNYIKSTQGPTAAGKIIKFNSSGVAYLDNEQALTWGNIGGTLNNQTDLVQALAGKVNVVEGKTLSSNDYTDTEKQQVAKVSGIEGKIPNTASSTNQLADRSWVNEQIASSSGDDKGHYNSVDELPTTGVNKNDYATVDIKNIEGSVIRYDRYKYSGTEWLFDYSITNSTFTLAQQAAIDSGVTSAKVTSYDNHITDQTNPHKVTKNQLGLGNVDNTSDENKPLSAEMRSALNNKANTSTTIGSHNLASNITIQNLFDDIKEFAGEIKNKVIDGLNNTLKNIQLNQLANLGGSNFGKPIIVGNDGYPTVGSEFPVYDDLSDQITENEYNDTNVDFDHAKMVMQNGIVFYNISGSPKTDITDKQSNLRKLIELPPLSGSYAYPEKIDLRITQAECDPTSMENIHEWWEDGGGSYVPLSTFQNKRFMMQNSLSLALGYNDGVAKKTYADAARTQEIYVGVQNALNGVWPFNGMMPVLEHDNDTSRTQNLVPGNTYSGYVPHITSVTIKFGGYEEIEKFYGEDGEEHVADANHRYWKLRKIDFTIDADYLRKAYYASQQCPTDPSGNWGYYKIHEDLDSVELGIKDFAIFSSVRCNNGGFGTAEFIQAHQTENDVSTQGTIINNALYCHGSYTISRFSARDIL